MTLGIALQGDETLVAQAFRRLRMAILRAELAPGSRLRLEALQECYGLSSSPLREALNRLAAEGLVELEERRGFRVKPASTEEFADLIRIRLLLETEALRLSIAHGDDGWEAHLLGVFHRLQRASERFSGADTIVDEGWGALHREFHFTLLGACGSPNLILLCESFFLRAQRYRHLTAHLRKPNKNVTRDHRMLMDAALARNEAEAVRLLTSHIDRNRQAVMPAVTALLASDHALGDGRRTVRVAAS